LYTSVIGHLEKPDIVYLNPAATSNPTPKNRPVFFTETASFVDTPVYQRSDLRPGTVIDGPALVEEYASTTVILPGDRTEVGQFGDLIITIARLS
jgi:N-methylhydantoinase A